MDSDAKDFLAGLTKPTLIAVDVSTYSIYFMSVGNMNQRKRRLRHTWSLASVHADGRKKWFSVMIKLRSFYFILLFKALLFVLVGTQETLGRDNIF